MSTPQQWLEEILSATELLLQDETLTHQQVTFVQIIRSNTERFKELLSDLPRNQEVCRRVLIPSTEVNMSPTSIVGYSQILLEYPEQFGATELSKLQNQKLRLVYNNGNKIRDWIQSIYASAETERQQMQKAPPQVTNLNQFFDDYLPLFDYYLKDYPTVELSTAIPKILPFVMTNPYHLSHLLQHIIMTIPRELIKEGMIHLSASVEGQFVLLSISCDTLRLTEENINLLFEKQGRHIYRERLEAQGGKLNIRAESQIYLYLARS
jgi:signal transduction histidine kinase